MKIAMFSSAGLKFMEDIKQHWEKKGHQVDYEPGANPALVAEADLTYIDFLDNNFYRLWNGPDFDHDDPRWQGPEPKGGPIFVRAIDIDIWMGRHRDERIYNYMDGLIVINEFFRDMVQREGNVPAGKLHLIRPGVNLGKFKFRQKTHNDYRIACVTGNFWEAKAYLEPIRLLDLVRRETKKDYTLHMRGQHIPPGWQKVAMDHLIDSLGLKDKVTIYGPQPDMNEWYQDKDYILVTSYKEAFSYAAAEGMAVGLKPVISDFFGSADIWGDYRYRNWDDAVRMLHEPIMSEEYRAFIYNNYDLKQMLTEFDDLLHT